MHKHTRREFLKRTSIVGGVMSFLSPDTAHGQEQAVSDTGVAAPSTPIGGLPAISIARWEGESVGDDGLEKLATRLTEETIAALGGMGRFVSRGDVVWIKPNMAWNRSPELAANTNPDVIAALVRLCLDAGAKVVKVGDNPIHEARQCYATSGIAAAAGAAGAKMVYVDEHRFREVDLNGERLRKWPLYPEIIESDLVINVPVVKDHGLATATLCMKNYMGVAGGRRDRWHQDLATCLCDLTGYMKPRLCVLDAVRVMTDNGPTGGSRADVKRLDTVAAGTDIVALDAFGASLLGYEPARIAAVKAAHARGLGEIDYTKLTRREIAVS